MYEQNIRDTDGKRHIDKLRDDTHNSNANNNGSKKNDPSKRRRAERIQLTPPIRETIPEQKAEPVPEKRIKKEKKRKSGRFKKWWKNIPAAPVMEYVPNAKRGRFDMPLFTVVIILLVMGIIMMSSASYAFALQEEQLCLRTKTACCGGGRICRDDNSVTHRLSYVGKAVQNDRQKEGF